jgi:hypothetical protein
MTGKKKPTKSAAQVARHCLDCPGHNSLMCCKRKPVAVNDDEPLFDGKGRPML